MDLGAGDTEDLQKFSPLQDAALFLLPLLATVDLLDKTKQLPKVVLAITAFGWVNEEGNRLGNAIIQHVYCLERTARTACTAFGYAVVAIWWLTGRHKRPCPIWWGFIGLLVYVTVCSRLPSNDVSTVVEVPGVLDPGQCAAIVAAAEAHGRQKNWTTARHGTDGLSTEDIPLEAISGLDASRLRADIAGRLAGLEELRCGYLEPRDTFVVRYRADRGRGIGGYLRPHVDGGTHTYSIVLSELQDYEGGGVRFPLLEGSNSSAPVAPDGDDLQGPGRILRVPQGDLLLQPAKATHEGMPLQSGTRYLLISFNTLRAKSWRCWLEGLSDFHGRLARSLVLRRFEPTIDRVQA